MDDIDGGDGRGGGDPGVSGSGSRTLRSSFPFDGEGQVHSREGFLWTG